MPSPVWLPWTCKDRALPTWLGFVPPSTWCHTTITGSSRFSATTSSCSTGLVGVYRRPPVVTGSQSLPKRQLPWEPPPPTSSQEVSVLYPGPPGYRSSCPAITAGSSGTAFWWGVPSVPPPEPRCLISQPPLFVSPLGHCFPSLSRRVGEAGWVFGDCYHPFRLGVSGSLLAGSVPAGGSCGCGRERRQFGLWATS